MEILDRLKLVEERYLELCARAERPDFYADAKKAASCLREQKELEPVVKAYRAYLQANQDMAEALELMSAEPEMKAFCQEEYAAGKKRAEELEQELKLLLLPRDPNDGKNVIMEIRGGVGGEESALFAHSLFRMYQLYAAAPGLDGGAAELQRDGTGRRQGGGLYGQRSRRLFPAQV